MPLDFVQDKAWKAARRDQGARSHQAGLSAEDAVWRRYLALGYVLVASRKRCPEGEIDLLLRKGAQLVAVEVKCSATHDLACEQATQAQLRRVSMACERCMLDMAAEGIADMRLDLALVDGQGRIEVLESLCLD